MAPAMPLMFQIRAVTDIFVFIKDYKLGESVRQEDSIFFRKIFYFRLKSGVR